MAIKPIQLNIKTQRPAFKNSERNSYLEVEGAIDTRGRVKPLPPKGHLVTDSIKNSVKYFFKDIGYDLKAIKDGFNGTANDHQLGRLNDVGLKLGGIGIATYLASKTSNPRIRLMEYIGLGAFLTSMNVYPKVAIYGPSKIVHGFDIGKEYIDDQGRKKSVFQDANYVPYEMYQYADGKYTKEDLDKIGDAMGIDRDIHNRHELIKEQMRKISTQNNTLWMLTAGVATPLMTGLICNGIERGLLPALEKYRNNKFNKEIAKLLEQTTAMGKTLSASDIKPNQLSESVEKVLKSYKGQQLPKEEIDLIISKITTGIDENASEAIRNDLKTLFESSAGMGKKSFVVNDEVLNNMVTKAKAQISRSHKEVLEPILVPSKADLEKAIKIILPEADFSKEVIIDAENFAKIKTEIKKILNDKISQDSKLPKSGLQAKSNVILNEMSNVLKTQNSTLVTDDIISKAVDFSKIIGEFKEHQRTLDLCKNFKVEEAQDTILARYYEKFEKTLFKELKIKFEDLKKMRDSGTYTQEVLDKKLTELAKDDARYKSVMEKLGKVVSEMEVALNGNNAEKSVLQDLINAYENNFNNTAKRIHKLGFANDTVDRLVKQNVDTLDNVVKSRAELFDYLDGITPNKFKQKLYEAGGKFENLSPEDKKAFLNYNADGVGSSKNLRISRLVERYQGVKNTFNRIMHTLEVYKRAENPSQFAENLKGKPQDYINEIIRLGKNSVLTADSTAHNLKLNLVNNPDVYKDLMESLYQAESGDFWSTKQKGFVTDLTKDALGRKQNMANGNLLERYQYYITRFRNLIANSELDFMKPEHRLNHYVADEYTKGAKTEKALFDLVAKDPVGMFKEYAGKRFGDLVWLRKVGAITAGVFGFTLLVQFAFGKIRNPQNIIKVSDDANK